MRKIVRSEATAGDLSDKMNDTRDRAVSGADNALTPPEDATYRTLSQKRWFPHPEG
jgi:hypothetical protein